MAEAAMVTGRMSPEKKTRGNDVLREAGMNASQAINLMYDRLLQDQNVDFLVRSTDRPSKADWARAAHVVDSISQPHPSRFDEMSRVDIKRERLRSRGLM